MSATVALDFNGSHLDIEIDWVGAGSMEPGLAPLVFLHEGLGSVAMWKDFPARLCQASGRRGLVYSRPGYGSSTPRRPDEKWGVDFLHRQAEQLLPALLQSQGHPTTGGAVGHSDGASIALIHAARFPERVAAAVVLAPHIFVEAVGLAGIRQTCAAYESTDLRQRLARYHDDVDSAFRGWSDIWLDPEFADWTIEELIADIQCPVLAIQGTDDGYGTMAQIDGIGAAVAGALPLELAGCGHAPHQDQPESVIRAVQAFLESVD